MKLLMIWLTALVCLVSAPVFAQTTWSGYLVDSRCYDAEERDISPFDNFPYFVRDKDMEVAHCTPNLKTKSFAVVGRDGMRTFKLDPAGNTKAAELVQKTGKKSFREVTVTGEMEKNTVMVNSLLQAK